MKKVTMTNAEVKGTIEGLNALTSADMGLSPRIWFQLTVNRKALIATNTTIEEVRLELVKKYSEKNEEGVDEVPVKNMDAFGKEYNELLNTDSTVEMKMINLSDIEKDLKTIKGIPNLFLIFQYLVTDEEAAPKKAAKKK
jgi:hypothetical protein